jgi:ABC-type nitrate/sulfonate/bicarbonate transport system substrate-binding protein
MFKWRSALAAGSFGLAVGLAPTAGIGQEMNIIMALPSETLTFSAAFLAEDAGFYKKEGLNVSHRFITGVGSPNAVLAGSADFTIGTGPVFLRAAAKGQRMLAIANLIDKPLVELVLRKDVAEAAGITGNMPLAERAKRLKDKTIAIQGVGSIVHAWERFVAARGGLDPETDVRIAPMEPPSMWPALQTKAVDGFVTSMPYTTDAIVSGDAVLYASAARGDAPDILPFAAGLVITNPKTCQADRDKCLRVVRALVHAAQFVRDKPDEALNILRARYKELRPASLEKAWPVVSQAHIKDIRVTVAALANSEKVSVVAKLLDAKDKLASYDGLWTDEYIP